MKSGFPAKEIYFQPETQEIKNLLQTLFNAGNRLQKADARGKEIFSPFHIDA